MEKKPKYKKRCSKCGRFTFIRSGWNYCMVCWEKGNGKYKGADRQAYIDMQK